MAAYLVVALGTFLFVQKFVILIVNIMRRMQN